MCPNTRALGLCACGTRLLWVFCILLLFSFPVQPHEVCSAMGGTWVVCFMQSSAGRLVMSIQMICATVRCYGCRSCSMLFLWPQVPPWHSYCQVFTTQHHPQAGCLRLQLACLPVNRKDDLCPHRATGVVIVFAVFCMPMLPKKVKMGPALCMTNKKCASGLQFCSPPPPFVTFSRYAPTNPKSWSNFMLLTLKTVLFLQANITDWNIHQKNKICASQNCVLK